jgi:hypothetical protein
MKWYKEEISMLTVGKLKKILEKYDDDVKIVTISDNYEMRGSIVDASVCEIRCRKEMKRFKDDFDETWYSAEVYCFDDNGEKVIYIRG